jgi:7-alpha-hydroxysteroid dehydrogenase
MVAVDAPVVRSTVSVASVLTTFSTQLDTPGAAAVGGRRRQCHYRVGMRSRLTLSDAYLYGSPMLLDRFRMTDRVAIVTGAGRGIGAGIALAYAELGADVVCAARTPEQLESVATRIRALGRRAVTVPCDVNERGHLEQVIARTLETFGRIDVLVNNAGGFPPKPALETGEKFLEAAFHFNVTSAFLLSRFAIPHMAKNADGGVIVNVSSAAGRLVQPGFLAYGTAKAALAFMTRLLAAEVAPRIRVNAIAVGATETSALAPFLSDETREKMEARTPLRRNGTVEDIALAAVYLGSSASSWVTGKVLEVDGGTEATTWPYDMGSAV